MPRRRATHTAAPVTGPATTQTTASAPQPDVQASVGETATAQPYVGPPRTVAELMAALDPIIQGFDARLRQVETGPANTEATVKAMRLQVEAKELTLMSLKLDREIALANMPGFVNQASPR